MNDISQETVARIVDSFSVHRPRGAAKGTLARQNLKARLRKHIQWEREQSLKTGFYAGQSNAGVSLEQCHNNWIEWNKGDKG